MTRATATIAGGWLALATILGCDGDPLPGPTDGRMDAGIDGGRPDGGREAGGPMPVFPPDVGLRDYLEMRDCRHSHEHELRYIRVLASRSAQAPYAALSPAEPYPVGATLVKLEYDDELCETLVGYTAMQKQPAGTMPAGNDWLWQKLTPEREVTESGAPRRCIDCHVEHCAPPFGYDLTCAEEL